MKTIFVALLFLPVIGHAHARLKASAGIQPRSTNSGIKQGPCGVAKNAVSPTLNAGSTITVNWEETVQHPGRFEFRFSSDDDVTFSAPVTIPDTQDSGANLPHQYSTTLTLPNIACTNCTLQMIQVMTENPANPSLYYSCADFKLVMAGAPTATPPPPGPSPTPIPGIDTDCNMTH